MSYFVFCLLNEFRLSESDLKLVWANRSSSPILLSSYARGLPILLQSVPNWHTENIKMICSIIDRWPKVDPLFGLELLDCQFPDGYVRNKAAEILSELSEDDFIDLLPQLVQVLYCSCYYQIMNSEHYNEYCTNYIISLQALKHEFYLSSPLSKLLLERVAMSPRIAHYLYW